MKYPSLLCLLFLGLYSSAQTDSAILYKTFEDYKANTGKTEWVTVAKRSKGDIAWVGGHDYVITSDNRTIKSRLRSDNSLVLFRDTLFFNCNTRKMGAGYAKVLVRSSDFLYFRGALSKIKGVKNPSAGVGYAFGAIGGGIEGANAAKLRFNYLYDPKKNEVRHLDRNEAAKLLDRNPELKKQYLGEKDQENEAVITKYLTELVK